MKNEDWRMRKLWKLLKGWVVRSKGYGVKKEVRVEEWRTKKKDGEDG